MSSYANYSALSRGYDATRAAAGAGIIAECIADCALPAARQHLLDAGCGTANYAYALRAHVRRISAVDVNAAMLARARAKAVAGGNVAAAPTTPTPAARIEFHRASIDALPFRDAVFDAVMLNQVLHHLDLCAGDGYPHYRRVFGEFVRVLKPGGALLVNTCSRAQLRHGFWYYDLIPEARERMRARHAPLDVLRELIEEAGLAMQRCIAPLDVLMQDDAYFNARGPLDPGWRAGDSIWSSVNDAELQAACARVMQLERDGALQRYMREQDAARKHTGQMSFLYARRG